MALVQMATDFEMLKSQKQYTCLKQHYQFLEHYNSNTSMLPFKSHKAPTRCVFLSCYNFDLRTDVVDIVILYL